jgi:hypothetical protein
MGIHIRRGTVGIETEFLEELRKKIEGYCQIKTTTFIYPFLADQAIDIASAANAQAIVYVTKDSAFNGHLFDNPSFYTNGTHIVIKLFDPNLTCIDLILTNLNIDDF